MELELIAKFDITDSKLRTVIKDALTAAGYPFVNMGNLGKIDTAKCLNNNYEEIWVFNNTHGMTIEDNNLYERIQDIFKSNNITKDIYEHVWDDMSRSGNSSMQSLLIETLEEIIEKLKDFMQEE